MIGLAAPALAQVVPPMSDPPPGSTLTSDTVTFTGGAAGQPGEQHWLSVGISVWDNSIFHQSLGTGHITTVSGLPSSGTLYVRYFTYTPAAGWDSQAHTYTMNVADSEGVSVDNPPFGWDTILDSTNGDAEGCNSSRFTCVLNKQAVRDNETGLVWERSPDPAGQTWEEAFNHCAARLVGGRRGWHLPMLEQLAGLMDPSITDPSLPMGHPFVNVDVAAYHTATTAVGNPMNAYYVHTSAGTVNERGKDLQSVVWCVRGGQSYDGQDVLNAVPTP